MQVTEILRVATWIWKIFGKNSQNENKKSPIHPKMKRALQNCFTESNKLQR